MIRAQMVRSVLDPVAIYGMSSTIQRVIDRAIIDIFDFIFFCRKAAYEELSIYGH